MKGEKLLITGGSGFLGSRLADLAAGMGWRVCATWLNNRPQFGPWVEVVRADLRDRQATTRLVGEFKPAAVIHTAYSQNDRSVTLDGTLNLLEACLGLDLKPYFVYTSTDLVFDGRRRAYTESDAPVPLMDYGRDKLETEGAVRSSALVSAVIRTSLMYDFSRVPRHLSFAVEAVRAGRECRLYADEFRSPVFVDDLARGLLGLVDLRFAGLLHMAGADRTDRYSFGLRLLKALGCPTDGVRPGEASASAQMRPADCSLDSSKAEKLLGLRFRGVDELLGA